MCKFAQRAKQIRALRLGRELTLKSSVPIRRSSGVSQSDQNAGDRARNPRAITQTRRSQAVFAPAACPYRRAASV